MNLDDICPIVDTVTDLALYDKRGVLHDLAHRAAHTLNVRDDIVFNALLKRGNSDQRELVTEWRFRTCG
jgi:hypothetical protein